MSDKLTGKQKLWADAYITTLNQTESARLAGYSGEDNVLAKQGSENVRNPKIMAYVRERLEQHAMSAEEVLVRLTDIARGDIADCVNEFGAIDVAEAKRRGKSHLIKRIKIKETRVTEKDGTERDIVETELELHDSLKADEILSKYHDLTNRVKVQTWEDDIIADIKAGKMSYSVMVSAFDEDMATRLFIAAGVPIG